MPIVYPREYFRKSRNRIQKASCFVLMPFDKKFVNVYLDIKKTLESSDLNIACSRADDFYQPHIIETILSGITKAEYIIADLTEANPNVFYELGLAHSCKDIEKVIIITQDMKYIPFDLRQFRCIVYKHSENGDSNLPDELTKAFKELAIGGFRLMLIEDVKKKFSERLIGDGNYIYELDFDSPSMAYDGIKLQINFTQLAADRSKTKLDTQYLYLSRDNPTSKINNIPWTVNLIRVVNKEAIISIEKIQG